MIQSILFDKRTFSIKTARRWLKSHNYKYTKVDTSPSYYRFRQYEPTKQESYRLKDTKKGILFIVSFARYKKSR